MREFSPLHNVEKLRGSFLLTAGMEDPVVGFEQTKAFENALRNAGLDVTALYFDREGHGYAGWQTKLVRAREIELFLSRKLGGKAKKSIRWPCCQSTGFRAVLPMVGEIFALTEYKPQE